MKPKAPARRRPKRYKVVLYRDVTERIVATISAKSCQAAFTKAERRGKRGRLGRWTRWRVAGCEGETYDFVPRRKRGCER